MKSRTRRAAAFLSIGIAVSGCGGPPATASMPTAVTQPDASPRPSDRIDTSDWVEFASAHHHFSIRHPPEWEVTQGAAEGDSSASESIGSSEFDRLRGDGVTFLARAFRIPGDTDELYDWIDGYAGRVRSANPGCFPPGFQWSDFAVQGYYGGPAANGCESITVVGGPGHAWEFRLIGEQDPELFDILLSWVQIDDGELDHP